MATRSVWCRITPARLPSVSSWNRSSSLASTCSIESARSRPAASSIASGMPSSRSQIPITAASFSGVSAEAVDHGGRPRDEQCHGVGLVGSVRRPDRQRRDGVGVLARRAERLPTRRRGSADPGPPAAGSSRSARTHRRTARRCPARAAGCLWARDWMSTSIIGRTVWSCTFSAVAIVWASSRGSCRPASVHYARAVHEVGLGLGGQSHGHSASCRRQPVRSA